MRPFFPEEEIATTNDAVACVLRSLSIDRERRNVLVAHQFVAGAALIGSEDACALSDTADVVVGGADLVEARHFDDFDYVALGHLHHAQNVGTPRIRYCGTPLKYSFSEAGHDKSVTVVHLDKKGEMRLETLPLVPRHDLRQIRGMFAQLADKAYYGAQNTEDYLYVILTDEEGMVALTRGAFEITDADKLEQLEG